MRESEARERERERERELHPADLTLHPCCVFDATLEIFSVSSFYAISNETRPSERQTDE